jgi:hypothetical protein
VYGEDWETFMLDGINETYTFPTLSTGVIIDYYGCGEQVGTVPKHPHAMYAQIWNRYFRDPTDDGSIMSETATISTDAERVAGKLCARLKTPWSTGLDNELSASDREVTVTAGVFDIADLEQVKGQYKTEVERQWFGQRYNDILKEYGGYAGTDADERPTLLNRKQRMLSGHDVDGTGDASLGQFSGKTVELFRTGFPTRYFGEHGAVFGMALVRFPPLMKREMHPWFTETNPSYADISGDPEIVGSRIPEVQQLDEWFQDGAATDAGLVPYGQRFRYHPNIIGSQFAQNNGFPLLNTPTTHNAARYHQGGEYAQVFQTAANLEMTAVCGFNVMVDRVTPGPLRSIFAGTD